MPPQPNPITDYIDTSSSTPDEIDFYDVFLAEFAQTSEGEFLTDAFESGPFKGKGPNPYCKAPILCTTFC